MSLNVLNFWRLPTADQIRERQIEEAGRLALEHSAAAEHHRALAEMYEARISRLGDVSLVATHPFARGTAP